MSRPDAPQLPGGQPKARAYRIRRDPVRAMTVPLPSGPFDVIYADPPWRYDFNATNSRRIENHYATLSVEEISELPVRGLAPEAAVLFLWSPAPKLNIAFGVARAWGFSDYKTAITWRKPYIGSGWWCRERGEHLLIFTRGRVPAPRPKARLDSVLEFPRTGHAAKPREFYRILERMTPWASRRLELFARGRAPSGWTFWGAESVPETGPGRPRTYHFDAGRARELRDEGRSWRSVLSELHLPLGASRSVRRSVANPLANGGQSRVSAELPHGVGP
ncbi:MAG: MT-A70 family methyltransferase [Acidimicrobiales bacterium]